MVAIHSGRQHRLAGVVDAYEGFKKTQSEKSTEKLDDFRASTYQKYQGEKLTNRFNAFTYWLLSKAMDSHNVGRGRESVEAVLRKIEASTLVVGIESDILFPLSEQKFLAENIPRAKFEKIPSSFGHDGFLVEFDQLKSKVKYFLKSEITVNR